MNAWLTRQKSQNSTSLGEVVGISFSLLLFCGKIGYLFSSSALLLLSCEVSLGAKSGIAKRGGGGEGCLSPSVCLPPKASKRGGGSFSNGDGKEAPFFSSFEWLGETEVLVPLCLMLEVKALSSPPSPFLSSSFVVSLTCTCQRQKREDMMFLLFSVSPISHTKKRKNPFIHFYADLIKGAEGKRR